MPHRPRGHQLGLLNSRLNLLCQRWEVNQRGDRWGGSGWDIQEPPTLCQTLHLALGTQVAHGTVVVLGHVEFTTLPFKNLF